MPAVIGQVRARGERGTRKGSGKWELRRGVTQKRGRRTGSREEGENRWCSKQVVRVRRDDTGGSQGMFGMANEGCRGWTGREEEECRGTCGRGSNSDKRNEERERRWGVSQCFGIPSLD
jgi:hypothetical protein